MSRRYPPPRCDRFWAAFWLVLLVFLLGLLWFRDSRHRREEQRLEELNDQAARVGFGIGYSVGYEDKGNNHPPRFDVDGNEIKD